MTSDHDLVIIGGGAAALAAAHRAVAAGTRPLVVTDGPPGGDCTFTGCVPSKTLISSAAAGLPFGKAMARVRDAVAQIAATEDERALRGQGIDVLRGRARFVDRGRIKVGTQELRPARTVIATGGGPQVPPIPGLDEAGFVTTDTVFELTEPPASMVILGGGAIGCELGQALARLGVTVTIVEAVDRLLPGLDPQAGEVTTNALAEDGVTVHTGTRVESVTRGDGAVVLHAGATTMTAQRLLVATGRAPDTSKLGLDAAGVNTNARGHVVVDSHLATSAPGVYAAGDVTGLADFTHAAYAMGRVAASNALRRGLSRRSTFSTAAVPAAVFTEPEVAAVGVAEHEVTQRGARVAYLPMAEVDRAIAADATAGFVKLIAGPRRFTGDLGGGRLLGATIVCARAGELISEAALAMTSGMFTGRLAQATHPYPTWSIALQQAAAQFFGEQGGRTARPIEPRGA